MTLSYMMGFFLLKQSRKTTPFLETDLDVENDPGCLNQSYETLLLGQILPKNPDPSYKTDLDF